MVWLRLPVEKNLLVTLSQRRGMAGEDQTELIDFDTTYSGAGIILDSVSMKPLLPAPLSSFAMCDYGANPFDQLMELTNKNLSSRDDPFEMVFEKASANTQTETQNVKHTYSNTAPSKCENASNLPSQLDFTNDKLLKNMNVNDNIHKSDKSGGLLAVSGTKEAKAVNTAKLLDLPSPVFASTADEPLHSQEEDKANFTDSEHNNEHDESTSSNCSKTNGILVHSDQSDGTPTRNRRYTKSDAKVKEVIAKRVEKCIQKALNDSRELFKSGSVTDLRCCEPKAELLKHRRSYSFSSVQKLIERPANGNTRKSLMDFRSNSTWLRSGDTFNAAGQISRRSSRFSRSFDDLHADINMLDAKVSWKAPDTWKLKEFLLDKCGTTTTCGTPPECLGLSLGEDAVEVHTEADNKSVFLDARSLSYLCEKASEGNSPTNGDSIDLVNDVKPPWMELHSDEDVMFDEPDEAGQQQNEYSDVLGQSRMKSDDSKVFSDSNLSLDSSSVLNPITHSTPVLRKDLIRASALCTEAKISPLLPVAPVLGNSAVVTQKLRPVRGASQPEQKKGPLKAVVPVVSMTRTTKKGEAVAGENSGKISQNVKTHKAESVTTVSNDGKKPLRTETIKGSTYSQNKVSKSIASANAKEDKKIQPIRRINSLACTRSPSSSKIVKNSTPLSDKGQKCVPRVDTGGRERSRSYEVKELQKQNPLRKPLQKSRSATSVPLVQSTTGRLLTEKKPDDSARDKNSPASIIRKIASNMTPKLQTPIRKIATKLGRHMQYGKENKTP